MGIFSINIRWVRIKQKSHPTPYYECYGVEAHYTGRTTYQLQNYVKEYTKIADSSILVKVTCCCRKTSCTYFFGKEADFLDIFYHSKSDRRSHPDEFCKKGALKNFDKFTGKLY